MVIAYYVLNQILSLINFVKNDNFFITDAFDEIFDTAGRKANPAINILFE